METPGRGFGREQRCSLEVARLNDHEPVLCPPPHPRVCGFLRVSWRLPHMYSRFARGQDSIVPSGMGEREEEQPRARTSCRDRGGPPGWRH